jgi:hypothetical protein
VISVWSLNFDKVCGALDSTKEKYSHVVLIKLEKLLLDNTFISLLDFCNRYRIILNILFIKVIVLYLVDHPLVVVLCQSFHIREVKCLFHCFL